MKASDLFVNALENEGVKYIFGIPGEENLDLLDSIRKSSIKLVLTRHEQAAGFMAATIGRLTGKAGVCISTLGPGAANLVTAAAYAQLGGMPMVMVTGQKPIKKSKQGQFQIVNVVDMMKPLTKFTKHHNTLLLITICLVLLYQYFMVLSSGTMAEEMIITDLLIQILAGLIIALIVGFASFTFILYRCIHKQARKINQINKAFAVVLKLLVIDSRKNHPDSEYITEIDKIYKEIVADSD